MSVRRRVILGVSAVLVAGVLAGAAFGVWRWQAARDPQLQDELGGLDVAVGQVLDAAGDEPAVAVNGLVRAGTCGLGVLRTGGHYTRSLELYTAAGDEGPLLDRVAGRLPAADRPTREGGAGGALDATVGAVSLTLRKLGDGWLVATATTGCVAGPAGTTDATPPADDPGVAAITGLLGRMGTAPAGFSVAKLPCPGGQVSTVAAYSRATDSGRLADRVPVPEGAHVYLVSAANRVAYRFERTSVVVAASDDGNAVTVRRTQTC